MDWTHTVDIYCERVDASFWAEPVNAASNISFLLAAFWAWRLAVRQGAADGAMLVLTALTAAIGVGSFLFHTFAQAWAAAADVLPILLFVLAYAYFGIRRFFGISVLATLAIIFGYVGATAAVINLWPAALQAPGFNGSLQYAPVFVALLLLTGALSTSGHPAWRRVGAAWAVLGLSLYFRTIDIAICEGFPLGAHFMWHILNGVVFALALSAFALYGRARLAKAS